MNRFHHGSSLDTETSPATAKPSRFPAFVVLALLGIITIPYCEAASDSIIQSGCETDYPPFCVVDAQGRPDGFSVELFREALGSMGRDVAFRTGEWAKVKGWLASGEVQALPLVGRTPDREALFDFTFSYMTLYGAIVVRNETMGIETLEDLRGRSVAVMKADNAEEFLRREPLGIEIRTAPTFEHALRELAEGRHDAVVIQRLVALRLLPDMQLKNLRIVPRPIEGFRQDFCFAVRKGDATTLALLNEGLSLAMADGTFRRLHAKWFAALELPSDRRIIIGGDHIYPPFEYLDGRGRPAGMNVDLTRAIARATGMEIEFRLGPWPHIVAALERGEIDALQGMYYSPERAERFDFSQPYLTSHYVSVVRAGDRRPPATLKDLEGLTLAVQDGDIIHDHLVAQGLGEQLILAEDQESVLKTVAEGRADCALVIRVIALRALQTQGLTNLELGSRTFLAMDYCYAVRKGNKALLAQIMEGLQFVEESGEYRRITDKWLGVYDRSELTQRVLRIALWIAVPLAIALAGFSLWTTQLRRRVAARTRELRESESNYRLLIENVHEIIFTLTPDGTFTFVSPSWTKLLGHPIAEIVGRNLNHFMHPDDLPVCKAVLQQVIETGDEAEGISYRVRHADGTWRRHSSHVVPLNDENGAIIGVEGIATDITGQREAEENYQMLFNKMLSGFAVHEMIYDDSGHPSDYRFIRVNPAFERMTGLRAGDIEGKRALDVLPQTENFWIETYGNVATTGEPAFFENYSAELGKWFEVAAFRPAPNQFACVFSDTTQRKQAEARIEHLNRVLRAIRDVNQLIVREHSRTQLIHEAGRLMVDHRGYLSALVVLTNASGEIEEWAAAGLASQSDALREMLDRGQKPPCCDRAQADSEGLLIADRKRICGPCPFADPCGDALSISIRLAHGGREFGWLAVALENIPDINEEERDLLKEVAGDLGYALHNIQMEAVKTEAERQREKLSEQLNQAQKMESIGRLAGGVAHDFNNLLMGILGYVDLARERIGPDHPARECLDEVRNNAERSADLTRQLLAFARKQTVAPKVLDLNDAVGGMLKLLRRLLGEDIDLAWVPGLKTGSVTIDPSQLDQILANLCVNARDAIAGVGKLTIETDRVTIGESYCLQHADARVGEFVMLAVSDSGCGMSREVLDHLFEPFFTTKDVGQGTGLGLATVYGIVKQNEGFINVYSEPGQGTTFKIYLPGAESVEVAEDDEEASKPPVGGTETLLLVEDEKSVRALEERFLKALGYDVIAAENPKEALRLVAEHKADIPLLVTDVVMPGMSGRDLSNRLRELRPAIRTLYMSGYTANVIAHQGVLDVGVEFLQKPVSLSALAAKIRQMLDAD